MATPSRAASSLRWVLTLLAVVLAGAGSLVGAGPASALTQLHTYDAATYSYDGALRLSTVHAPVEAGLGLPAGPRVAPGVSHVSIGWFGVAAEAGADAQALLAAIGQEGKTAGVLNIDGELTPLVSGTDSLGNYAASGHVEGQAALIMREQGVTEAELLIDNPNGICGRCVSQVPTLLPEGAQLTVRTPLGTVPKPYWFNSRTLLGNASDPKPWPR